MHYLIVMAGTGAAVTNPYRKTSSYVTGFRASLLTYTTYLNHLLGSLTLSGDWDMGTAISCTE